MIGKGSTCSTAKAASILCSKRILVWKTMWFQLLVHEMGCSTGPPLKMNATLHWHATVLWILTLLDLLVESHKSRWGKMILICVTKDSFWTIQLQKIAWGGSLTPRHESSNSIVKNWRYLKLLRKWMIFFLFFFPGMFSLTFYSRLVSSITLQTWFVLVNLSLCLANANHFPCKLNFQTIYFPGWNKKVSLEFSASNFLFINYLI